MTLSFLEFISTHQKRSLTSCWVPRKTLNPRKLKYKKYLNENERYQTNTNLFVNISDNTGTFESITWHQKKPLGCVGYSHCTTNDSNNNCINSCCCLPYNFVTKPFGILQRPVKSQKVCKAFGHSKNWYLFFQESLWLKKFSDLLLNFQV